MPNNDEEIKYTRPSDDNSDKKERKSIDYYFKIMVVAVGVVIVFAIILGSYLWNLIFNPEGFVLRTWLERVIFNTIIALTMMVLGFIDLDTTLRSSKKSEYFRDRGSFNEDVGSIYENDSVVYFDQFIPWHAERQLRRKKINYLTARGITTADAENLIDYASEEDLPIISGIRPNEQPTDKKGEDLVKKVKKRLDDGSIVEIEVVIPAIKGTNAAYVQDMLSGSVKIDVEDPSYYLTDSKTKDPGKTTLERAQSTENERRKYLRRQFVTKGLSMAVFSLIFSLLAPADSEISDAERAWVLIQRLAAAIGGFGSGALAGVINVSYVTRWINDKHKVVTDFIKFYGTKIFVPKTREQLDQAKIAEFRKKEAETITPEVVQPNDPPMLAQIEGAEK